MRCLLWSIQEWRKGTPFQVIFFHDHLSLSPSNYNYVGNGKYKIVQDIKVLPVSKMF